MIVGQKVRTLLRISLHAKTGKKALVTVHLDVFALDNQKLNKQS